MASSSTLRSNNSDASNAGKSLIDLETRATKNDHQALRLWLRLLSCTVRMENQVRGRLRVDFETTLPRFDLMAQLERYPEGLRMSELSKRLMVTGGNITGITDQLEQEGLVVRKLDLGDRRAITVKLTETGLQRFRQMAAHHEQWIIELLGGLTQEEKQTMLVLLRKLKIHLSTQPALKAAAPAEVPPRRKKG
ncbi:MAG: MarR family winged helix-turn-helix transcriptional regulator [Candidatus Acidiferrales bacterium]